MKVQYENAAHLAFGGWMISMKLARHTALNASASHAKQQV